MYYIYILLSAKYEKTYVGITNNLEKRLIQHNKGYHFYTKRFLPWKLMYQEEYKTRQKARKREKYFKSAAGRKYIKNKLF